MAEHEQIDGYTRHAASAAMPDLSDDAFDDLVQSMRDVGFDNEKPIMVVQGKNVIVGWHRLRAAKEAGVEPVFFDCGKIPDVSIRDIVYRDEIARRHMSPGQRADAVINLDRACGVKFADPSDNQYSKDPSISKRGVAERANVSRGTAQRSIDRRKQEEGIATPKPEKTQAADPAPTDPHPTPPVTPATDPAPAAAQTGEVDPFAPDGDPFDAAGTGVAAKEASTETREEYLQRTIDELRAENEGLKDEIEALNEKIAIVQEGADPKAKSTIDKISNDAALIRTQKSQIGELQSKVNEKDRALKAANAKIKMLEKAASSE